MICFRPLAEEVEVARQGLASTLQARTRATAGGIGSCGAPTAAHSAVLCALVGAAYVYVQFSQMIILGFEGKRWSLSSKVYAEPSHYTQGFRFAGPASQPGTSRLSAGAALRIRGSIACMPRQVDIALREFRYPYRREPARTIRVTFRQQRARDP